jgi:hypothetical protein
MTLPARNLSLRIAYALLLIVSLATAIVFLWLLESNDYAAQFGLSGPERSAVAAAAASTVTGAALAGVYLRLFRRSPSLAVYFVVWFYLAVMFDVTKLLQLLLPVSPWPQFTGAVARVTIFGHVIGVMALFASGLYAGGVRMQRHGTALFVGMLIAFGLSWSIPIDTSTLPAYLVYETGMRASLRAALWLLLAIAAVNFVHAAFHNGSVRGLVSAGSVALMAIGREILFYQVSVIWTVAGTAALVAGGVIFAGRNYRDFLFS